MIEIKNIYKSFENKDVLKNISKVFNQGETNLIIGRSGSGKTVLLKSIVGLHEIDKGQILYDNRDFTSMGQKLRKKLRQEMGMVFQGGALFDSLLDMYSELSNAEKQKQVDFCLERVNISDANKLYPSEISGGMQKRVAIARSIVLNPKYLFCDEPNSGLDPETSMVIDELIHSITVDLQITTIINTHDMNSVMEIGENIIFINKGEKAWQGAKEDIFHVDNEDLNDFVFASELYKKVKKANS